MQQIALDMLRNLFTKKDKHLFFIIDDTQTLKRAKKMEAVGKLHHHATGKYGTGHTILKVCLYYRGVTIPWASLLYIKYEHAVKLKVPFRKLAKYGRNVLHNSGIWCNVTGLRKNRKYRLAERFGKLNKLGTVKIVFSRRKGENKHIAIFTDNLRASIKSIVADYLKRWSIEMLIKDEKQHLGLGDYRVLRYRAVVRHLHLVDCAYACLTHMGLKTQCAQGQNKSKKLLRLEAISKLKDRMRRILWQENVQDVIKYSHEKPVIRRLEKLLAA